MKTKRKNVYCEIAKSEKQEDGTLIVSGFASTGQVDSDGDTITPEAMKAALPDYMKFGAVREMHQASAAGTALEANVNDEGKTEFTAHVVDPVAVLKVETNVYKGFSIGGKVTERDENDKSIIKGLNLIEVSLVDRPANPGAVFTMYKAEGLAQEAAVDELAELLDSGTITPEALVALAKAAKPAEPTPQADKPEGSESGDITKTETGTDLKKGMWSVSDFASLLQSVGYLASDAQWESEYEGDNSPIPAQLRQWLKDGAVIFQAMAAEEAAELVATLTAQAGEIEIVTLAEKAAKSGNLAKMARGALAKAGKKFSADTASTLGDVHKAMKECCDKLAGLGYDQNDDDDDPANQGPGAKDGDSKKSASADDLKKVNGELDLMKAQLGTITTERDTLAKRVKELEALPAPGKALLKVLSKGDDLATNDGVNKVEPVKDAHGQDQDAATLIKAAHRAGGQRVIV